MEPVIEISNFKTSYDNPLEWELLTAQQMSRINFNLKGASVLNEEYWHKMFGFIGQHPPKFKSLFQETHSINK